jgi:hypothetical protein
MTSAQPGAALSDNARTVCSFLLFVHLFALAVAVLSNASLIPEPGEPPDLKRQLRQVPVIVPYLQLLDMDYSYMGGDRYHGADFHLTHDHEWDLEYRIELSLTLADGSVQEIVIPNETLQPRLRRLRYQMLATRMARLQGYDGPDAQLPLAVATHYVRRLGATGGTLRCVAELQRTMTDLNQFNPASGTPLPALESRVALDFLVLVQGENVMLMNAESTRDAAAPDSAAAPQSPVDVQPQVQGE